MIITILNDINDDINQKSKIKNQNTIKMKMAMIISILPLILIPDG